MALKQTEARILKSEVIEVIQKALKEKGYYSERIESGLAIAVDKDGLPVSADFEKETFFFVANPTYKKEFDLDEEIENWAKKQEKAEEKANGTTSKAKVSAKDLDISTMSAEDLAELEERLKKQKGTMKKPESLKTKEDKEKEKNAKRAEAKKAMDKAIQEGVEQAEKELEKEDGQKAESKAESKTETKTESKAESKEETKAETVK